jgi:DNA polymerase-3 subunit epsilon
MDVERSKDGGAAPPGTGPLARDGLAAFGGAEAVAAALEAHADYRVLRRLAPRRATHGIGGRAVRWHGLALDVETEGLDPGRHAIVELAMQRFLADAEGRIVEVGRSRRWLEDPGRPLTPEITRLTGIRDADVAGRSICDAEAVSVMLDVDFVVAHNARFDLPFCAKRLPAAAGRPWICTLAEVDWRAEGYEGRSLPHLLMQAGFFYHAHSARTDVAALIRLLEHEMPSGRTVLRAAMDAASRSTWLIEAVDAPYAAKDVLRERGYRWHPARRVWWLEVPHDARPAEMEWACREVYRGTGAPTCRALDWTNRHVAH